jgi:hypothetical protein
MQLESHIPLLLRYAAERLILVKFRLQSASDRTEIFGLENEKTFLRQAVGPLDVETINAIKEAARQCEAKACACIPAGEKEGNA